LSRPSPVLEGGISWILRAGVTVSLIFETTGLLLNYATTGETSLTLSPHWLVKGGNFFGFVASTLGSLAGSADPVSITGLGIAVLVLTPYFRIVAAVVYYAVERDWNYVAITTIVFFIVTLGLVFL
jgi:uncharacterized membrane protein